MEKKQFIFSHWNYSILLLAISHWIVQRIGLWKKNLDFFCLVYVYCKNLRTRTQNQISWFFLIISLLPEYDVCLSCILIYDKMMKRSQEFICTRIVIFFLLLENFHFIALDTLMILMSCVCVCVLFLATKIWQPIETMNQIDCLETKKNQFVR